MVRLDDRGTSSDAKPHSILIVCLAIALVAAVWAPREAHAVVRHEIARDTLRRSAPRLFEKRVFFSARYLASLLEAARGAPTVEESIAARNTRETAARYASRYDISEELATKIVENAVAEGVDPELAFRLVRVESVFEPNARGPAGALGLTQLMPATARAINRALRTEAEILDPDNNLRTGLRYLRQMIEQYDGDVRLGLLAYNRGETIVNRVLRAGRDPENGYSAKVLGSAGSRYTGAGLLP